jgi:hypothetical protein
VLLSLSGSLLWAPLLLPVRQQLAPQAARQRATVGTCCLGLLLLLTPTEAT